VSGARAAGADEPRRIHRAPTPGDRVFRFLASSMGMVSMLAIGATAVFLVYNARPALKSTGVVSFFVKSVWNPTAGRFGVGGLLIGTVMIAAVALIVALPISLATAIFINEYAPARVRKGLVLVVDLLAALPSLIFGMWGLFALQEHLVGPAQWLSDHLSAIPMFQTDQGALLARSTFIGGVVVGIMVIPIITSVSRDVMSQVPREQCEGALALGGSRWGMIRDVILPFGRTGIIGATILGFGRALGETIAVALVVSIVFAPQAKILQAGGGSIAGMIATQFGEANELARSALVAAGLALFILTLIVSLAARAVVRRAAKRGAGGGSRFGWLKAKMA